MTKHSSSEPHAQTSHSRRRAAHLLLALGISFLGMAALCLPFALTGSDVPGWLLMAGRWIPAAASIVALLMIPLGGSWREWWCLKPGGWRGVLTGYAWAVAVMAAVIAVPALIMVVLTPARLAPVQTLASAGVLLAVGGILFAASTLGEEVFWRGHLRLALGSLGFWRSSMIVGVIWMLWHLPLHLTYWFQGVMPTPLLIAGTVSLLAWAPLLAALVEWRGSIWPAAFAHAVPVSAHQLVLSDADEPIVLAAMTSLTMVAMLVAAVSIMRGRSSMLSGGAGTVTGR